MNVNATQYRALLKYDMIQPLDQYFDDYASDALKAGIFGAMNEGMTGDPSILIAKSFLDFFTAMIFACSLGIAVSVISIPLLIIQLTLAWAAALIIHHYAKGRNAVFAYIFHKLEVVDYTYDRCGKP